MAPCSDDDPLLQDARAQLTSGQGAAALNALLADIAGDRSHPYLEHLRIWLLADEHRPLQEALYRDLLAERRRAPQRVLRLAQDLADLGLQRAAIHLLSLAYAPTDPFAAYYIAQWAMDLRDYPRVLEAADIAIVDLMRRKAPVDRFMLRCLRSRAPLALLRFHPSEILSQPRFRKPLVLRWEALHRREEHGRARLMADFCQRLFPNHISVWTMAGNHALDRESRGEAKACFARALSIDPDDVPALVGLAILSEKEKNWQKALRLRKQVADVAHAFAADDPASLHRVIRYAAALGRLERWQEAGRLLRDCIRLDAFERVPNERSVLLRVFCGPLYSPAMVQHMLNPEPHRSPVPPRPLALPPELLALAAMALRDAHALRQLAGEVQPLEDQADAHLVAGMLAWELRDPELAHQHFDQADGLRPDDMSINYLLMASATEVGAPDLDSIARFALALAQRVVETLTPAPDALFYAQLTLERLAPQRARAPRLDGPAASLWQLARTFAMAKDGTCPIPAPEDLQALCPKAPSLHACVALREAWSALELTPQRTLELCTKLHLALVE